MTVPQESLVRGILDRAKQKPDDEGNLEIILVLILLELDRLASAYEEVHK